jgi:hypothetical protein
MFFMKILSLLALSLACCAPYSIATAQINSQTNSIESLINGEKNPITLPLKEMDSTWKRIVIHLVGEFPYTSGGLSQLLSTLLYDSISDKITNQTLRDYMSPIIIRNTFDQQITPETIYYTQGKTQTIGSETFLITYKSLVNQQNLIDSVMKLMIDSLKSGKSTPSKSEIKKVILADKASPDTLLSLELVNTKQIKSLSVLRPFELKTEITEMNRVIDFAQSVDLLEQQNNAKALQRLAGKTKQEIINEIAESIRKAFQSDKELGSSGNGVNISVKAEGDKIFLTGMTKTTAQKKQASDLAEKTVKTFGDVPIKVLNQIIIKD